MKEYDYVKMLVEKACYAKKGVHKDMTGWICDERIIDNCRLVCFDNCDMEDYPIISVKIEDIEVIWEAPVEQVGVEVVLSANSYEDIGLRRGLIGTIIAEGKNEGAWVVRFNKQEGMPQEIDITVNEKDISII